MNASPRLRKAGHAPIAGSATVPAAATAEDAESSAAEAIADANGDGAGINGLHRIENRAVTY